MPNTAPNASTSSVYPRVWPSLLIALPSQALACPTWLMARPQQLLAKMQNKEQSFIMR